MVTLLKHAWRQPRYRHFSRAAPVRCRAFCFSCFCPRLRTRALAPLWLAFADARVAARALGDKKKKKRRLPFIRPLPRTLPAPPRFPLPRITATIAHYPYLGVAAAAA